MDFTALTRFELALGAHDYPRHGLCLMEAVAWLEGLAHTDAPECTCPVVAQVARAANDWLPHQERQKLVRLIPKLVGTNDPDYQAERVKILFEEAVYWRSRMGGRFEKLMDAEQACASLAYEAAADHLTGFLGGVNGSFIHSLDFHDRIKRTLVAMIDAGPNGGVTGDPQTRVREYEELVQ